MKIIKRFLDWAFQFLIALDQVAAMIVFMPAHLIKGVRANPDETISSRVGRQAIKGKRWALLAEKVIDAVFVAVGGKPGHCRNAIGK